MNLHSLYSHVDYESFEKCLVKYLKTQFNVYKVVDTSYFRKKDLVGISCECPAVVLYVERVYPTLVKKLSTHKTFQQIAADFISEELRKEHGVDQESNHRIISVMQCYDKKDEIGRDGTSITHFIGTKDLYEFIKKDFVPCNDVDYPLQEWERTHVSKSIQKDPHAASSNNFLDQDPKSSTISRSQSHPMPKRGSNHSRVSLNMNEISGLESCINVMNRAKDEDVESVELRICKNGCINGPAQVRTESLELHYCDPNIDHYNPVYFETSQRTFIEPKRKTFNIEW